MKFCPYCGKQNPDDATFCIGCGKEIPTVKKKPKPEPKKVSAGKVIGKFVLAGFVTGIVLRIVSLLIEGFQGMPDSTYTTATTIMWIFGTPVAFLILGATKISREFKDKYRATEHGVNMVCYGVVGAIIGVLFSGGAMGDSVSMMIALPTFYLSIVWPHGTSFKERVKYLFILSFSASFIEGIYGTMVLSSLIGSLSPIGLFFKCFIWGGISNFAGVVTVSSILKKSDVLSSQAQS